jgi:putative membrane protein
MTRVVRSTVVVASLAALTACGKGDNKADSAAMADSAARASAASAPAPTTTAPAPLNDANIAALLDEVNAADSAAGNLASTKGTSASVKDFGRMMMRDHHTLRKAGQDLAKKANLSPTPPAGDTLPSHAQKMSDSLNAQAKGAAWDQAYIGHEVSMHQGALSLLQTAQGAAQDTSLKALITKAIPNVQAHLTKAQGIQAKLGGSASSATPGGSAGAAAAGSPPGTTPSAGDTAKKKKKTP